VPALLSSLIGVPRDELSAVLAADGPSRPCLRGWLARVRDPRSPLGRWHPLEFVLGLAVCAFTAAGHDSPSAIAEWAAGCCQETLAVLGGRRDPWAGRVRPPCEHTFRRVFTGVGEAALNDAVHGYLAAMQLSAPDALPETTRHEREQRRAAARAREPAADGLLEQAAADGKTVRGAVRRDGSQVHLLSAFHVGQGRTLAQREAGAKTSEIPELAACIEGLDLAGMLVTVDALHTQRETVRLIREVKAGHYLMIVKANQPALLEQLISALAGPDEDFAGTTWIQEGNGHGRREKRAIRTAPADGIDWPHAAQVMRIRRDSGPARGPWTRKEIAYGITSLPPALAGPRHLACYARHHWAIENREHYVRDKTFSEDLQQVRTGKQPGGYAAICNLVIGAFRHAGFANIAHARRYYGRDDRRVLALCGYT